MTVPSPSDERAAPLETALSLFLWAVSATLGEFMADMVLPNGQTMHEWAGPQLARGEPVPFLPAPSKELGPGS